MGAMFVVIHRAEAMRSIASCAVVGAAALTLMGCNLPDLPFRLPGMPPSCPSEYIPHKGHLVGGGLLSYDQTMEDCGSLCDKKRECLSIEYSPSESVCIVNILGGRPGSTLLRDYQFCEKPASAKMEDLQFGTHEVVEQRGTQINIGGNVRVYAVGSSNILWMTWIDQLHLYLRRLGYNVPAVPVQTEGSFYPSEPQTCDDTQYFNDFKTARLGKIGWHSWDFSYDDWSDCSEGGMGYRKIAGHKVKCEHGPGCKFGRKIVPLAGIAEDASLSDVTLVTTWFNDDQPDAHHCFDGETIPKEDITKMSIEGLQRLTRAIHDKNPDVWILILAKYSVFRNRFDPYIHTVHKEVQEAVEKEPRTLFIQYESPDRWKPFELLQDAHPNHPNCRGSKLMAHAILERLYNEKILARSLKLVNISDNLNNEKCDQLTGAACRTSVRCWVDPKDKTCKPYSKGSRHFFRHEQIDSEEVTSMESAETSEGLS